MRPCAGIILAVTILAAQQLLKARFRRRSSGHSKLPTSAWALFALRPLGVGRVTSQNAPARAPGEMSRRFSRPLTLGISCTRMRSRLVWPFTRHRALARITSNTQVNGKFPSGR
jgi:hypothetical protein